MEEISLRFVEVISLRFVEVRNRIIVVLLVCKSAFCGGEESDSLL
jgi:hypothetical protein